MTGITVVERSGPQVAAKVDAQNEGGPLYRPMAAAPDCTITFRAAGALVFERAAQPNGYTEPLLHKFHARKKTCAA